MCQDFELRGAWDPLSWSKKTSFTSHNQSELQRRASHNNRKNTFWESIKESDLTAKYRS